MNRLSHPFRSIIFIAAVLVSHLEGATSEQVADRIVRRVVSQNEPGVAVMVSLPDQAAFTRGYGLADISKRRKIRTSSLFDLASVSKPFTALAVLSLVDDGRLSLDTPVADVVTDFKVPVSGRAITVRDLLQHTSGLRDYSNDYKGSDAKFARLTTETHLTWLNQTRVKGPPGRVFEYNNSNFCLLARVAEVVDGKSFDEIVRDRVLLPAGMERTFVYDAKPRRLPPSAVKGYIVRGGVIHRSSFLTAITGDGNVYTSADDMARFIEALWEGRIVSKERLAEAWTPGRFDNGKTIDDEGQSYGLGWECLQWGKSKYAAHSGYWFGTSTSLLINRQTGLCIVVLSNDENLDTIDLTDRLEFALKRLLTPEAESDR